MTIITVASAKGGAGKTTTAVGLFLAARAAGIPATLIDADRGASAKSWLPDDPDVYTATSTTELRRVLGKAGDSLVIVDTPPLYENSKMIEAVLRSSSAAVIPVQPSRMSVERLPDLLGVLPAALPRVVVPSMIRASTTAAGQLLTDLAEAGIPTTRTVIPLRESIAQLPGRAELGQWGALFASLLAEVEATTRVDSEAA